MIRISSFFVAISFVALLTACSENTLPTKETEHRQQHTSIQSSDFDDLRNLIIGCLDPTVDPAPYLALIDAMETAYNLGDAAGAEQANTDLFELIFNTGGLFQSNAKAMDALQSLDTLATTRLIGKGYTYEVNEDKRCNGTNGLCDIVNTEYECWRVYFTSGATGCISGKR